MYRIYTILLFFSLVVYFPVYLIRSRFLKRESLHFRERCGFRLRKRSLSSQSLWIHAVSVGEVLSLQNLIVQIKNKHPDWKIFFSCLTETGFRMAKEKLEGIDDIFFVPLDFRGIVRKFFRSLKPDVFILAESEFWPNLLREAKRSTKGVLLVNGRVSSRSFRRYKKLHFLVKRVLSNITLFLVQTEKDKKKLEILGADSSALQVAGNLKAEIGLPDLEKSDLENLRKSMNIRATAKVIVAGSIHKGEEEPLLDAFSEELGSTRDLVMILAPRHPERANDVEKICQKYPVRVQKKTRLSPGDDWDVLILDTLGELAAFYALSDVAFVGGSLIRRGGHNLLEPAFYAKPVFFGPHMDNFAHLAEIFVDEGAARFVRNKKDLRKMFSLHNDADDSEMGQKAQNVLQSLQGATEKTLRAIESLMADSKVMGRKGDE